MSARELEGQVALVTGATRGIGRTIAEHLARAGARVAVVGRTAERAEEAAASLAGVGHRGYACDVADPEAAAALVRQVEEDLGGIDILVNNAGITDDNLLMRLSDEAWDRVLETNLKGPFNLIRAVTRGMMRRRSGRIINITSVVGLMGNPGQANYAASKAGLIGLTKTVARELASRGILCNAVAPGFIESDMTAALPEATRASLQEKIALGRLGTGDDVASVVRFLAGPGAGYITGQTIVVDGGMVI
ncbi:MAG: 3-oxoacyl-[acyl-carrier-protein] reductase [Candidatus Cloacimonetes bacterium]|jgi:3-oxoacyl-[acyl-carrier protein] reductase|nr:3-oxoacyl-[acyl-carrier-protein] reductase [Candidatus Cloacimonadota bacterium]